MVNTNITIARRIQSLVEHTGRQVELADRLGISEGRLSNYLRGTRKLPIAFLPTIADFVGQSVDELLGRDLARQGSGVQPASTRKAGADGSLPDSETRVFEARLHAAEAERDAAFKAVKKTTRTLEKIIALAKSGLPDASKAARGDGRGIHRR